MAALLAACTGGYAFNAYVKKLNGAGHAGSGYRSRSRLTLLVRAFFLPWYSAIARSIAAARSAILAP